VRAGMSGEHRSLSIIIDLRRFQVMEQSAAPNGINMMMTNMEQCSALAVLSNGQTQLARMITDRITDYD